MTTNPLKDAILTDLQLVPYITLESLARKHGVSAQNIGQYWVRYLRETHGKRPRGTVSLVAYPPELSLEEKEVGEPKPVAAPSEPMPVAPEPPVAAVVEPEPVAVTEPTPTPSKSAPAFTPTRRYIPGSVPSAQPTVRVYDMLLRMLGQNYEYEIVLAVEVAKTTMCSGETIRNRADAELQRDPIQHLDCVLVEGYGYEDAKARLADFVRKLTTVADLSAVTQPEPAKEIAPAPAPVEAVVSPPPPQPTVATPKAKSRGVAFGSFSDLAKALKR